MMPWSPRRSRLGPFLSAALGVSLMSQGDIDCLAACINCAISVLSMCWHVQTPVGNTFMMYRLGVSSLLQGAWQNMK